MAFITTGRTPEEQKAYRREYLRQKSREYRERYPERTRRANREYQRQKRTGERRQILEARYLKLLERKAMVEAYENDRGITVPEQGTDWRDRAKCRGRDTEEYLSKNLPNSGKARYVKAHHLCHGCPVMLNCAKDAVAQEATYYVRAGLPLHRNGSSNTRLLTLLRERIDAAENGGVPTKLENTA